MYKVIFIKDARIGKMKRLFGYMFNRLFDGAGAFDTFLTPFGTLSHL